MPVIIKYTKNFILVKIPYNAEFNTALGNNDIKRKFNKEHKFWIFSIKEKDSVLKLLNDYYGTNYENSLA